MGPSILYPEYSIFYIIHTESLPIYSSQTMRNMKIKISNLGLHFLIYYKYAIKIVRHNAIDIFKTSAEFLYDELKYCRINYYRIN